MKNRAERLKIVLTGGPGVGKSSIAHCLTNLGFDVRPEVFTELFEAAEQADGLLSILDKPKTLLHDLVMRQYEIENSAPKGGTHSSVSFYDRSMVDIIGFARNLNLEFTPTDLKIVNQSNYDAVFIVEPLEAGHYIRNNIRRQTFAESLEHHSRIIEVYEDYRVQRKKGRDFLSFVPNLKQVSIETGSELAPAQLISLRTRWILDRLEIAAS